MSETKLLANDSRSECKFVYRFNNKTAKTKLLILPRSIVKSNLRHIFLGKLHRVYKLFLILSLVYAFEKTNVQWVFLSCRALHFGKPFCICLF